MYISLPEFDCEIAFTSSEMEGLFSFLKSKKGNYSQCIVISDHNIHPLYGATIQDCLTKMELPSQLYLLHPGESFKTLETAQDCWNAMHRYGLDRHSLVISLGGGVVTDLSGFIASCYMRGVDVVHIPTTLLGMVDAALGGKTGVNLPSGKNLIGTFHHPKLVLVNPRFLASLPAPEFRSGLAEVIKYGVIKNAKLFEFLEKNMADILTGNQEHIDFMIATSCDVKAMVVRKDEKEKGLRAILNYGHTFAHAIETATNYGEFSHGEAVAIGMNYAAKVGVLLKRTDESLLQRQKTLCKQAWLPTELPDHVSKETVIQLMKGDKKAVAGKINLIVPEKIGKVCRIANVEESIIREAIG